MSLVISSEVLWWSTTKLFLYWSTCIRSWLFEWLSSSLTHHELHHLHHRVHLFWDGSLSFVCEVTRLIRALVSKFAIWMNVKTPVTIRAFWEEFALLNWMKERAIIIRARWIKSASYLLLRDGAWSTRCSTWCYSVVFWFLYLDLRHLVIIFGLESLSSLESVFIGTVSSLIY